jgi:hypothetical protein
MISKRTIQCPQCQKPFQARIIHKQTPTDGSASLLVLRSQCVEHGTLEDTKLVKVFDSNVSGLRLSAGWTVICPRCGQECSATVFDVRRMDDGSRWRMIEGDCAVDGLFEGPEFTAAVTH